jgi:mRNA interferase MazF
MKPKNKLSDIVLIPFPFTNLSDYKVRPALILTVNQQDVVLVFITHIKPKDKEFICINPTKENGLKEISYIKYTKIVTLESKLIIGSLGNLENKIFQEVKEKIKKFLNL